MITDAALLRRFVEDRDQTAFTQLVERHLGLVYAAALRRTGGRIHLAEEIAQKVFSDLGRRAAGLFDHPTLVGWLYRSTRYAAIDAVRAEIRQQKLTESLVQLSSCMPSSQTPPNWDEVRPVIDDAIDQLSESDRQIVVLRFLNGVSFAEAGEMLDVRENAARMRFARALEKLRTHLAKRGISSTTAALALAAADPAFSAAPAGLAATVALNAAASPPAGAMAVSSVFFMSKITAPLISAIVAATLTALVFNSRVHGVGATQLLALREENAHLQQAASGHDAQAARALVDGFAARASMIARAVTADAAAPEQDPAASSWLARRAKAAAARGFHDHGQGSPLDATKTMAWAAVAGDIEALSKDLWFDPDAKKRAEETLASMPDSIQAQFPTPEKFYAFLIANEALVDPPPGPDLQEALTSVDLTPGRAASRWPGSNRNQSEFQLTPDGWKCVVPLEGVENMPSNLNDETLAAVVSREYSK